MMTFFFLILQGWRPAITVKQILVGIQDLLDQPNPADPAQTDGYHLFIQVCFAYENSTAHIQLSGVIGRHFCRKYLTSL